MKKLKVLFHPIKSKENRYIEIVLNLIKKRVDYLPFMERRHKLLFPFYLLFYRSKGYRILYFNWRGAFWMKNKLLSTIFVPYFMFFAKLLGMRLVWVFHNIKPHKPIFYFDEKLDRMLIKSCNLIFVHNKTAKDYLKRRYKKDSILVPHPSYKIKRYSVKKVRRELNLPSKKKIYLFFGLIEPYKGVDELIKMFPNNKDKLLYIVGKADNKYFSYLKSLIKSKNIIMKNRFLSESELDKYISAADYITFPYKEVTTSGSILRALQHKKVVIGSYKGEIKELINKGLVLKLNKKNLEKPKKIKLSLLNAFLKNRNDMFKDILVGNLVKVYEGHLG